MYVPTTEHNDDRLAGTLAFLNRGTGQARFDIYDGARPSTSATAIGAQTLLVSIYLDDPAGSLVSHALVLASSTAAFVLATGTPTWARSYNGEGTAGGDCDVTGVGGGGQIEIEVGPDGKVYAGGGTALVSAVFT